MHRLVARTPTQAVPGGLRTPGLYMLRAYQDCRAGFAGRDMQLVRATSVQRSPPDPTQDAVLGRF
jgi:hypothetical protein